MMVMINIKKAARLEVCILGTILSDKAALLASISHLDVNSFFIPEHRRLFSLIQTLFSEEKLNLDNKSFPLSGELAEEYLREGIGEKMGGIFYLTSLPQFAVAFDEWALKVEQLTEMAACHALICHSDYCMSGYCTFKELSERVSDLIQDTENRKIMSPEQKKACAAIRRDAEDLKKKFRRGGEDLKEKVRQLSERQKESDMA